MLFWMTQRDTHHSFIRDVGSRPDKSRRKQASALRGAAPALPGPGSDASSATPAEVPSPSSTRPLQHPPGWENRLQEVSSAEPC